MKTKPNPEKIPLPTQRTHASAILFLAAALFALQGAIAAAATVNIDVGHDEFVPYNVQIQAGDTVVWTWTTDHTSSVTAGTPISPSGLFDSGIRLMPFTFSYTFTNPGHYDYYCQVEPVNMNGSIDVAGPTGPPVAQLLNISTRMNVQTGENVMIGGFIVTGSAAKKVLL